MNFKRFIITVLVLATFVTTSIAYAQDLQRPDFRQEEIVTLAKDEVIDRDFFGAGQVVEINGTVNGDVYAAGGEVTVSGVVNGDVLVAGGRRPHLPGARVEGRMIGG